MTKNINSPEVQELIKEITESRAVNPKTHIEAAQKLYDLSRDDATPDLKDIASCYLGEAYLQIDDLSKALSYLSSGIAGVRMTDEHELYCRSENGLGIIYQHMENHFNAQICFSNCIDRARSQRLFWLEAMACHNFAALCEEVEDYEDATIYRYRVDECLDLMEPSEDVTMLRVLNDAFIVRLYINLDSNTLVDEAYQKLMKIVDYNPIYKDDFEVVLVELLYFHYKSDSEKEAACKQRVLLCFDECDNYTIYFDECWILANYLFDIHDFKNLDRILTVMEEEALHDHVTENHGTLIAEIRARMYEATGDRQALLETAYKFMQLYLKRKKPTEKAFASTMSLLSEVQQQKASSLFLAQAADTDPLTGIANRKKLNEVIDELFVLANDNGKTLAVEMLDLDHFKDVNDTYGHSTGDKLLIKVANVFKQMNSDQIFVARYGGDEFIIYYYNMTDAQIIEKVTFIRDEIEKIRIEMNLPRLSVSQGIVNHVPIPINRAWDYMNVADEALYYVKGNGRNNARLVHSLKELKNEPWNKIF